MGKTEPQNSNLKSAPRQQINNFNPYNRLNLNKFHQIDGQPRHAKEGRSIRKKKRDLERLLKHKQLQEVDVQPEKVEELAAVSEKLFERRKDFEKYKRKEFFIEGKYKQIMSIQQRKVVHKLKELRAQSNKDQDKITEWLGYLNYIKYYPKDLKYVSLFPTNKPLEEKAREFQLKIMVDINAKLARKREQLDAYQPDNQPKKGRRERKDDFFLEAVQDQENELVDDYPRTQLVQEQSAKKSFEASPTLKHEVVKGKVRHEHSKSERRKNSQQNDQ